MMSGSRPLADNLLPIQRGPLLDVKQMRGVPSGVRSKIVSPKWRRVSELPKGSRRDARTGRKSGLFAPQTLSPDPRFADLQEEIGKSLRLFPQLFPSCGD